MKDFFELNELELLAPAVSLEKEDYAPKARPLHGYAADLRGLLAFRTGVLIRGF